MLNFASRRTRRTKYYRFCQYTRHTKSLPRAMEPEDVKHLVRLTRAVRDKALILMLLRTGMRVGELLRLRIQDINLRDRKVTISEGEKNRIGRVVYFGDDAKRALKRMVQPKRSEKRNPVLWQREQSTELRSRKENVLRDSGKVRFHGEEVHLALFETYVRKRTPECRYAS